MIEKILNKSSKFDEFTILLEKIITGKENPEETFKEIKLLAKEKIWFLFFFNFGLNLCFFLTRKNST